MGAGLSPFPYALVFPQDEHERLLIDRLAEAGVEVERARSCWIRGTRRPHARAPEAVGRSRERRARRPISPDATAHIPRVREALKIGFPGGTYEHLFYVADVEASGAAMNGEMHVALDTTDFWPCFR